MRRQTPTKNLGILSRGDRSEERLPRFHELLLSRASASSAAGQLHPYGNVEIGLVHPPAGIGSAVPALQRDGANVVALFVIEHFKEGVLEAGADLSRGAPEVEQPIAAVVRNRHRPPTLWLRFGGIKHGLTL